MTRVLVVDDQFLIRAGLVALLRAAPGIEVVGEAADGESAVEAAASARPDVILMDIRMPGTDGISATERILTAASASRDGAEPPRILVLTTFDLDEYVYGALRAGASGFLLKDAGPERLLAAVAAVAGGDMLFAPSVTRRLIEAYSGMSNPEIADRLFISEATVKTHFNRTMTKLDLGSRAQAVVLAYECGLVTPGSSYNY
jgi:DNA-binding NarL/FixJ family response regulator